MVQKTAKPSALSTLGFAIAWLSAVFLSVCVIGFPYLLTLASMVDPMGLLVVLCAIAMFALSIAAIAARIRGNTGASWRFIQYSYVAFGAAVAIFVLFALHSMSVA